MVDPVTYEVIRHRLGTTIEEGATALRNTSGSPTVAMSGDCNVALLDASGECLLIGRMIAGHATSCIFTVRHVLQEYAANPGFGPDDLFISNDPYISTPHQNCVVIVGPVYADGALVGWTGAGIHVGDMGGAVPGQVAIGAQSIWEEASRMPPVRLVERGVIRKDIEQDFLSRSRTPLANAMDMRSMIAANTTIKRRLLDIIGRYGADTVTEVMGRMLAVSEARVRAILGELPDGEWEETGYLDYHDRGQDLLYTVRLRMIKRREELVFDFTGSSQQAPAVINASLVSLTAYVLRPALPFFSQVIGTSPGPLLRAVRIVAPPRTIVNCSFPAGLSKGSSAVVHIVRHLVGSCLSRLMSTSETYKRRAFTIRGHVPAADMAGVDHHGVAYSGVLPRITQALGSGARYGQDGIDTGGADEAENMLPNIETNELRYPVLFLYQREAPDTGGAGAYRGGVGPDTAFIPHDVPSIPDATFHVHGFFYPSAVGLCGGYPGGTNEVVVLRNSNIRELFAAGVLPTDLDEVRCTRDIPRLFGRSSIGENDVYAVLGCGGGGYGDPLEREPERVAEDVRTGTLSREWARAAYGVVVDGAGAVDQQPTVEQREETRMERKRASTPPAAAGWPLSTRPGGTAVGRMNDQLALVQFDGDSEPYVTCGCGWVIGPRGSYKGYLAKRDVPCSERGPHYMRFLQEQIFRFEEWYCPSCYRLLEVEALPLEAGAVRFVPPPDEGLSG